MSVDTAYCDNCAATLVVLECTALEHDHDCFPRRHYVSELPVAVDSANADESAVLCADCFVAVLDHDTARLRYLASS